MRRINRVVLALTLMTASAAVAQGGPGRGGPGGRGGDITREALRGIELTEQQQEKLQAIREQFRPAGAPEGGRFGRGAGDSLGVRRGRMGPPPGDSGVMRRRRPDGDTTQVGRRPRPQDGQFPRGMQGDTAEFRERREQMEAQRDQMIAQVRSILTNAQRQQFDKNLQEIAARRQQFENGRPQQNRIGR